MNRTLLTATIMLFCGQLNAQSVEYKTDNRVNKLSPFKLGATLSFGSGFQTSAGIIAQGCVVNKLFYSAEFRKGLFSGFSNQGFVGSEDLVTTQSLNKGSYFDAGAEWALTNKVGSGTLKITTGSGYGYERFFRAQCDMRKIISVGGGVFSNNYPYYLGKDSGSYFESNGIKLQPAEKKYFHANINTFGVYGGVSFRKIRKAAVSAGGYRYRAFRATSWNFQVLVGSGKMQDISIGTKTFPITNTKSSPLGYRIAWRADRGPTSSFVEIGKLPHVNFTGADNHADLSLFGMSDFVNHFRLGFNFLLYGNDRRYGMKQAKKAD